METIQIRETGKIFLIPSRKHIRIINQKEVLYVRAESNYSVFVMDDRTEYTICHTLDFVERSLIQSHFFRCHKSFLVNLAKIKAISRCQPELIMINNLRLPIARRKRRDFFKALYLNEGNTAE
jgi:two-component system LytT family response regulator